MHTAHALSIVMESDGDVVNHNYNHDLHHLMFNVQLVDLHIPVCF
jgi:hypothetical protein